MRNLRSLISRHVASIYSILLLHHLCIIYECYRIIDDINNSTDPEINKVKKYGGRYYTVWNFVLQIMYLIVALLVHYWPKNQKNTADLINKIKGYMFITLVGPCAVFTLTFFWTVYMIDKSLVHPPEFDAIFSSYLKHGTHTTTFLIFMVEIALANHEIPKFKHSFVGYIFFHMLYALTLFGTYFHTGEWVYTLFVVLSWSNKINVILYENISSFLVMLVIFWHERLQQTKKQKSSKIK